MSNQVADAAGQRERIDAYLERSNLARQSPRVVPLTGDASDRRYYRVLLPDAPSIVLSLYAAPFDLDTLSFANVARLLEQMPVPIPTVLGHAGDLGVLALEDLGDVTLQAHLGAVTPAEHAARYRQAVALIATLQRRGAELESPAYLPYGIAFDVEKLMWEMDFFTKHFIEAYRGVVIGPAAREELHQAFEPLIAELTAEPRVLCHRDYHSRNLMLHHDRLYIIDFQDARMGPDTYDLVSLLRDSYVDLPERTVDELIAYFLALKGETRQRNGLPPTFRRDGAPAQPEGARHLRLPDHRPAQSGVHPVHSANAPLRPRQPRSPAAVRSAAGAAGRVRG